MIKKSLLLPKTFSIFLVVFFAIATISTINSCRKKDTIGSKPNEEFNIDSAKEWWYAEFRKSNEYKAIDWSSPLAPPVGSSTRKFPSWKRAISYVKGNMEIVEMPLIYETNNILLPGMQGHENTPEGERIARSSIHRLLIIKEANGNMAVRVVTLVPSPEYAKENNYDISFINLNRLPVDFSGYMMIAGWDESEKNIMKLEKGKYVRKLRISRHERFPVDLRNGTQGREVCDWVWVPNKVWVCAIVPTGDDIADQERCQEIGYWMDAPGGYYDLQCVLVDDEDTSWIDCLNGPNPDQCHCQLFNMGCPDPGAETDPYNPENDLALPCETPYDHSQDDTISTNNARIREAFGYMLPPQYAPFIQFDANGNLNTTMLLSAQTSTDVPPSTMYNALVACVNANFNIQLYISGSWEGMVGHDTSVNNYSWEVSVDPYTSQSITGITIIPGPIPFIAGIPATGNPLDGWIFIKRGTESSNERLAFVIAHELLGHMHNFIKGNPYTHNDPQFNSWVAKIEAEARKNWKMLKKWKASNQSCF